VISIVAFIFTVILFYKEVSRSKASSLAIKKAGIVRLNPEPSTSSMYTSSTFSYHPSPINATYPPAFSIFLTLVVIGQPPAFTRTKPVELKCCVNGSQPFELV